MPRKSLLERFIEKIEGYGSDGCWEWSAHVNRDGYGSFDGRNSHQTAYELWVGPVPDGFEIDHTCRNRRCQNPKHLEAVTHHENILRGNGWSGRNARKTHCPQGHEYTPENTYIQKKRGGRVCRECQSGYSAASRPHRAEYMRRKRREDPEKYREIGKRHHLRKAKAEGRHVGLRNQNKTSCPQGHEYTAGNTYLDKKNMRHCRACAHERYLVRRGRK